MPLRILETTAEPGAPLFVYISGDGGWNAFNESLCNLLVKRGIPVLALDAQKYFWKSRTPDETAAALAGAIEQYRKLWKRDRLVVTGYSFGAAIVPFVLNRLPAALQNAVVSTILIDPDRTSDFEIHLSDMLNLGLSKGKYNVLQEIRAGELKKLVAVFGSDGSAELQDAFWQAGATVKLLPGNHHFDSAYETIVGIIIKEISSK